MAINKRKILQSAQKHLQKGALDKALKDYQTLLEADPRDANVRLKIGDIHLKQGNASEAVAAYTRVANRFMQDGFDAKAVALYKQITKIDPKRFDVYVPLAELYQRLGLTSDAMSALQTAADAHYREGNRGEALDLLRKMAALDPTNTTNRLKVADLLRQEGRTKEALTEFEEIATELERQGDEEGRLRALERIVDADPSRFDVLCTIARGHLDARRASAAENAARTMLEQQPDELDGHELLAEALEMSGRQNEAVEAWRTAATLHKERGNEARARDIMQRFVSTVSLTGGDSDPLVLESEDVLELSPAGVAGELTPEAPEYSDPGYLSGEGLRLGEAIEELRGGTAEDAAADPALAPPDAHPAGPSPLTPQVDEGGDEAAGEGDPEQILAEASVYLRYGKQDRAIESLRRLLGSAPDHRAALEKLGEALAASGAVTEAVGTLRRALERAHAEGDGAAAHALVERITALDPAGAEALGPAAPAAHDGAGHATRAESDLFDGIDIEVEDAETAAEGPETEAEDFDEGFDAPRSDGEEPDETAAGAGDATFELDLDLEIDTGDTEIGEAATEDSADDRAARAAETQHELDAPEPLAPADMNLAEPGATEEDGREGSSGSSTTPQQIVESLEEANFYFEQGMLEEARALYEGILAVAPHHPQALLRMGEIEASCSGPLEAPGVAPVVSDATAPGEADAGLDLEISPSGETLDTLDWDDDEEALAPEAEASPPPPADSAAVPLADAALPLAEGATAPLVDAHETEVPARGIRPQGSPAPTAAPHTIPGPGTVLPVERGTGDFDLAAELSGALEGGREPARAGTTEDEAFEQVFAAFKEGVRRELGDGDHQAHYDLGIAYKEMGLLEDAMAEFGKALVAPERQLGCLHMMGLCALELGRGADATAHLEQALALPSLPSDQQVHLRLDLGRAYAAAGDAARARAAFEAVRSADPGFADIEAELAALESGNAADADGDAGAREAFESFDDLLEEELAEEQTLVVPAPPAPQYESFEDLIGEGGEEAPDAGAAPAEEDRADASGDEAAAPAEPEEEPPAPPSGPEPGRPRRKKISFV